MGQMGQLGQMWDPRRRHGTGNVDIWVETEQGLVVIETYIVLVATQEGVT